MRHVSDTGDLSSYSLPQGAQCVSHFCFTDDLVIFTLATRRSLSFLFQFIAKYEAATGQLVNKSKSVFVVSRHCPIQDVRMVVHLTGISQGSLPMRYLGCVLF